MATEEATCSAKPGSGCIFADMLRSPAMGTFLSWLGVLVLIYYLLKISLSVWRGVFACYLGPMLGFTVNFRKMGSWAVVTGATDGIGKAYAEELAARGLNIVLISRTLDKLQNVAQEIENKYKVKTKVVSADFTADERIYEHIKAEIGNLDVGVLVNNVGMSLLYCEYFDLIPDGDKTLQNIIRANVVSCTMMTRLILPQMEERKKGVVLNISSLSAMNPIPFLSAYAGTKAYIDYLSRGLQVEYKDKGIIIQSVLPGFVSTKMSKMRPSFRVPTAKTYVKWAIKTVGIENRTYGHPAHKLEGFVYEFVSSSLPSSVFLNLSAGQMKDIRRRYYKKFGITEEIARAKTGSVKVD